MEQHQVEACPSDTGERRQPCSWEEIVQTQQRYIYNLAYHLCGNRAEAEDLAQDTFLKAFENLAGFRQEAGLRTWLCRIAVNAYLAKRRRRPRHESITRARRVPAGRGSFQGQIYKLCLTPAYTCF